MPEECKTNGRKFNFLFREEVKWIIFIVTIIFSIGSYYFVVKAQLNQNTYQITQIEQDRRLKWDRQDKITEQQSENLEIIKMDIAVIKSQLEMLNKKLR